MAGNGRAQILLTEAGGETVATTPASASFFVHRHESREPDFADRGGTDGEESAIPLSQSAFLAATTPPTFLPVPLGGMIAISMSLPSLSAVSPSSND